MMSDLQAQAQRQLSATGRKVVLCLTKYRAMETYGGVDE